MIKMIQMKLKNKYYVHSLLVLYVCYWPGLEECSSVTRHCITIFIERRVCDEKKEKRKENTPRRTLERLRVVAGVNSRVVTLYYVRRIRCVVVFEILYELYIFLASHLSCRQLHR